MRSAGHLSLLVVAAATLLAPPPALAQRCNTQCPPAQRDPAGCCRAPSTGPHTPRPASAVDAGGTGGVVPVRPAFDIGGAWRDRTDGFTAFIFQEGAQITLVWVMGGHRYAVTAQYLTPTMFRGTGRRRIPTGCVHNEEYTVSVMSATLLTVHVRFPDGGCGMRRGQEGDTTWERQP